MFNLSSLEILTINDNLTGVFPPDMGNELFKLKTFIISYNKFHGVLPASVCNASMLQYIEIISTFLSGRVPECLGAHQMNLSVVALVESEFEATNDADWSFMSSLSNCSNMRQLGLESNKLKGVLPNSIANFSI
jgi:Leucine-rich repeat (LRR) protein